MAPPPEYDKEPKAPDKSATNISCEEMKTVHNLVNDQQNNSDNKSATTASNADVENNKLVETLDDGQLRALLDEAITYKCPKDREGKSSLFKELLEEVEQDEQATEAAARSLNTRGGSTRAARAGRNRRALPHSNSLQDLVAALAAEPAPRRHRPAPVPAPAPVSTRAIHGGSLPSGVDTSFLLGEEPIGGGYLATVRCVNPPPLTERLSSDEADLARRSKQVFPMTYTARATLEIGSGAVSSGRAVTTTTASNQVRTSPRTARYHPRKPRHQPAQTQTYRIPPVNGNREPYMLNRNKPNMALNYRNPPGSIPYANWQRPIVPYYRRPPTCGPPERICVKKLYNPKRRTFVKHVQTKRVLTHKSINDFKSEKKQQHSFGGEIESNSSIEHDVDEKTDNVKPKSPKDDNTKSDKSLSSGDENIDSNQSKLLRGLIPKTNCDKDNGGGSSKKTTNENEPRGPKANTENKNTEDKKHKKKNIENTKKKDKKLRKNPNSDLWETHNNNWYKNLGGFTQAGIAPEKGKTPFYRMFKEQDNNYPRDKSANIHSNFFVQNIARSEDNNLSVYPTTAPVNFSLNRPNNMTQNIYKGVNKHSYKKTNRKNEDWVSDDYNTRNYNYYDNLYQTEMKYRKCIGTSLVKRKIDLISPRNIRKMTIGKPLPDFFNIVDNSSTNEYTTDKVKVNNDENKTSKNIKESVSDVIQLSDSYEDFVASSNDTKETKNYFEEDDNIEDETVNLSARSSTPVNEPNDSVYQVTEQTKLEKEVDDIDTTSETIRNEDIPPPVENDQGTVHIPVVSQSDYIAIDDFCSFSQVKDEPCGEVVEHVKMSSIPEENTIEQLDIFKNINSTNENCVELKDMSSQGVERQHQEELLSISFKSHSEETSFSRYLAEQQKLFQALENSGVVDDSIEKRGVEQKHEEELLSVSLKRHHEENSFSRYLAEQQKLFQALENSGVVDDSIEKRGVEQKHEEELLSVSLKRHHEEYQFSRYLAKQQKLFQALENSGIVDNSIKKHGIEQKYEKQQKLFQALENSVAVDSIQKHSLVNRLDNSEKVHCPLENECISEYVQDKIEKDSLDIVPNEPTSSIVECSNSDTAGPCQEAVIHLDESAVENANGENVPNEPTSSIVECTNSDTVRPSQEVVIGLDESAVENANGKNDPNEPTSSLVECSNSDKAGTSQEAVIHLDESSVENANGENVPNEPTSSIVECTNSDTVRPSQEVVIGLDESAVENANGKNVPNEPTSSLVECSNSDKAGTSQEVVIHLDESAVENANGENDPNEPTGSKIECSKSHTAEPSQEVIHLDESAVENANGKNDPNEPTSSIVECSNSDMSGPSQKVVIHLDDSAVENANGENVPNEPTSSIVECTNSDTVRPSQEVVIGLDESAVENANGKNVPNEPTSSLVECSNSDKAGTSQEVVIHLDESAVENANGENDPNEPTGSKIECSKSHTAEPSQEVIHLDESAVENANGKNVPNEPTSSIVECSNSDMSGPSQKVVIHLDESAVENANCENVPNEPTSSIVEYSYFDTAELSQELVFRLDDPGVDSAYCDEYILGDNNACVFLTLPQHLLSHINYNKNTIQLQIENNTCEKIHCAHENEFSSEYVQYKIEKDSLDNVPNEPTSSIVESSNSDTAGPCQEAVIRQDESAVKNANGENVPNEPTSSIVECTNSDTVRPSQEVVIRLDESAVENANGKNDPNEPTSSIVECSNSDTAVPCQEVVIHLDESAVKNANGENVPNEPTSSIVECINSDTVRPSQEVVIRLDESAVENANGKNVPNEPTSSIVDCSNSDTAGPSQEVVIHLDESSVENANGENVPNEQTSSIVDCSNSDTAGPSQEVVLRLDDPAVDSAYCDEYILGDNNACVFLTLPQHLLSHINYNKNTIQLQIENNTCEKIHCAHENEFSSEYVQYKIEKDSLDNVPNEPTSSIVECSNSDTAGPCQEAVIRLDESAVENANGENVPNEPTSSIVECTNSDTVRPSQEVVIRLDESAVENANGKNVPNEPTSSIVECSNSDTAGPSQEVVIHLDESSVENANGENVPNEPTSSIVDCSNSDTAGPSQEVVLRLDDPAVDSAYCDEYILGDNNACVFLTLPQHLLSHINYNKNNIQLQIENNTCEKIHCAHENEFSSEYVQYKIEKDSLDNVPNEPTSSIVECSNSDTAGPCQEAVIHLDESAVENANGENVPNEPTSSIVECTNSDTVRPSQEVVIGLDESAVENANGKNVPNEPTSSIVECSNSDAAVPCQEVVNHLDESSVENANGENVPNEPTSSLVDCSNSDTAGPSQEVVIHLDESSVENANGENVPNEPTSSIVDCSNSDTAGPSQEVVLRLDDPAVESAYCDEYVLAELPYNAYVFLTLPQHLLSHINYNENTIQLQIENNNKPYISGGNSTKGKKKKISLENSKNREVTNKNALKTLLFENNSKSDSADKSVRKGTSTISKTEVDSAIPFSCITTPEVVASCNTTASTTQSAVAVDPKPLQLESSYRAVSSLTGELPPALTPALSSALTPAPAPAAPARPPTLITQDQPRSVISSTFNGLPLSRPNYGSTATTTQDEYKKSIDENGNSVQGFSSPLSGSSQHKKPRRKKSSKNETVIKSHQIDGYQGNKDLNEVLRFIESNAESTRAGKLGRTKHKDDADDKGGKKRSTERRKDKENKMKRATSMEELSRTKLEDLTDKPAKKERWPDGAAPKAERRSWGDDARESFYYHEPEPDADFQTVTKKRKPRRRPDDASEPPEAAAGDPPRPNRAPEPRARRVSAPPSDRSNDSNDDMDSVHSLPADAPRAPTHAPVSYADIARTRHNIPDLIESCNFYAEGEGEGGELRGVLQPAGGGYPALEPRAPRRAPPARDLKPGAPPATTNIRPHRKERAESGSAAEPAVTVVEEATVGLDTEVPTSGEWPAPDVVGDRRPAVILLDSAQRPPDMDGVTFGFDINEQLLGGPTRRPRCDLVRDAIEGGTVPVAETNGAAIDGVTDAADIVIGDATMGVATLGPALGVVTQTALGVVVSAGCAALRYVPPRPPPDTHHLHQIIDYVGAAWEDVVRCGAGKVRYFSE